MSPHGESDPEVTPTLEKLARQLLGGKLSLPEFLQQFATDKTADIGEAQLDLDRGRRCGFPEVVFGEGKSVETLTKIFRRLLAERIDVFATRISDEKATALKAQFPQAIFHPVARTFRIPSDAAALVSKPLGKVAVVTAGTSDLPIAEEARQTLLWMGVEVTFIQDVGVAGPHRLRERVGEMEDADAVVVVAGMEGALPSVVGGYVACPVIGVPTSVGYGASFGGLAALLSMLNSCAANVTVVNIDAGFKAAYVAGLIAKRRHNSHP